MKFQIGDIVSYNDPLFNDSYISSYFVISNIDDSHYYMIPLNDDNENQGLVFDDYLIGWVDDSPKWKKE